MELVKISNEISETKYNNKELSQRILGKFYTPETVFKTLCEQVVETLSLKGQKSVIISDPFAGDGRLVLEIVNELERKNILPKLKSIHLKMFELDPSSKADLEITKSEILKICGNKGKVEIFLGDSFISKNIESSNDSIDIVVTNPPWELLKPDKRELGGINEIQTQSYIDQLKSYDAMLAKKLPFSQPKRKFAGWGTNLSRCGLELSIGLLNDLGVMGIVIPSSVFSDQMSEPLRKWIFENGTIQKINFYPATTRAFENVDQDFVSVVFQRQIIDDDASINYKLSIYNKNIKKERDDLVSLDRCLLEKNEHQLSLEHGQEFINIVSQITMHPKFKEYESLDHPLSIYAGREHDETGIAKRLAPKGIPFIKGRSVNRFAFSDQDEMFVDPALVKKIPKSFNQTRLVWRDVARKSQNRRVQSMVVDPEILTGNSLHISFSRKNDSKLLKALSVIMNSMIFEAQVRSKLSTNHISLGVVRCCHIPYLTDDNIRVLTKYYDIKVKTTEVLLEFEEYVSDLYGLTSKQLKYIATHFFSKDSVTNLMLKDKKIN